MFRLLGPGVLHGQGTQDLGRRPGAADEPRLRFRTCVLFFEDCRHVTHYCTLAHLRNVVVDNLRVAAAPGVLEAFPRTALTLFNAQGALLRSIHRSPSGTGGPVLELHQVRQGLATGCVAGPGTATFMRLYGMEEGDVALEANALRKAKQAVEWMGLISNH